MSEVIDVPVLDSGLSTRSINSLMRGGYYSMKDVCRAKSYELLNLPEFGRKSLNEITEWARARGGLAGEDRWRSERQLVTLRERSEIIARDIAELERRLSNG